MRNFNHPLAKDLTLDGVLYALGDPIRLELVRKLASCPKGDPMNCAMVAERMKDIPLSTRHHHLRILRESGIIQSTRKGVEVQNTLRAADLEKRFPGLLATILKQK